MFWFDGFGHFLAGDPQQAMASIKTSSATKIEHIRLKTIHSIDSKIFLLEA